MTYADVSKTRFTEMASFVGLVRPGTGTADSLLWLRFGLAGQMFDKAPRSHSAWQTQKRLHTATIKSITDTQRTAMCFRYLAA